MRRSTISAASGGAIGVAGGLIGLGGAEFRLPVLAGPLRFSPREAVPINLVLSFVILSVAVPARATSVPLASLSGYAEVALAMAAGAVAAAWFGAGLLRRMSDKRLANVILALLVFIGILMVAEPFLFHESREPLADLFFAALTLAFALGLLVGLVSSLLGVAGGELIIPSLVLVFGVPIKAAGTLSLLISLPTIATGLFRHRQMKQLRDKTTWRDVVVPMSIASALGAVGGGLLLGVVSATLIKVILGTVLIWSASRVFLHVSKNETSPVPVPSNSSRSSH